MRELESGLWTDLTEKQEQVLDYIEDCVLAGLPPTRAEIARHFGFRSANAAQTHLEMLVKKGRIEIVPSISRGIKLLTIAR